MKRYIQHEPFNIYLFSASQWPHPVHTHSYFEIIVIRSGSGRHFINGNTFAYDAGDVFLLGPEDYHYFEILQTTAFCYIRFTELFVKEHSDAHSANWLRTFEFLLNTPYQSNGSMLTDRTEKDQLDQLLAVLLQEYSNYQKEYAELIMNGLMKAILGLLARNVVRQRSAGLPKSKSSRLIEDLLLYICQHIHEPEALRLEQLAEKFHFSANYLSVFFKKQTGESVQQYIVRYKLKMIENRLRFSDRNISQITAEFGFTDGSHLNKLFQKYYGMTPGVFRNKNLSD